MMKDIELYTIPELENLKIQASILIEQKKEQAIDDAYNEIIRLADSVGLSVGQLMEIGKKRIKGKQRKPVEIQYRNKNNNNETWTGRGKRPKWLVMAIESGAKLEDFKI